MKLPAKIYIQVIADNVKDFTTDNFALRIAKLQELTRLHKHRLEYPYATYINELGVAQQ